MKYSQVDTKEEVLTIPCGEDLLCGILHRPVEAAGTGVVINVGGPQYRVGSHRQFLLLARALADEGFPVLRFDYRGMGDNGGELLGFEDVEEDIRAAVDAFVESVPGVKRVVLWGLCDAASAALFYAHKDARITGLVLLNPWVRSEAGIARSYLKHYYLKRLVSVELWRKVIRGEFQFKASMNSLVSMLTSAFGIGKDQTPTNNLSPDSVIASDISRKSLADRMADGLSAYKGKVLFILSGDDLTAGEFKDEVSRSRTWRRLMKRASISRIDFPEANHTFSRRAWRERVARWTVDWLPMC